MSDKTEKRRGWLRRMLGRVFPLERLVPETCEVWPLIEALFKGIF